MDSLVKERVEPTKRTADAIVELDSIRALARDGLTKLTAAIRALPAEAQAFAHKHAALDLRWDGQPYPETVATDLADARFARSCSEYSLVSSYIHKRPLDAPFLAHRLQRLAVAFQRVLEELPKASEGSAIDAVDTRWRHGIPERLAEPIVLASWHSREDGGDGIARHYVGPAPKVYKVKRSQMAEALGTTEAGLERRRSPSRRRVT